MTSVTTHRPFLEHMDRFGLIDDPTNLDGLPIGLTADTTRDLGMFRGFKMVGVNCAACHTAEFQYKGNRFILDGAPAKFDLHAYFTDLFSSAQALKEPEAFITFFWQLSREQPYLEALLFNAPVDVAETKSNVASEITAKTDGYSFVRSTDAFDKNVVKTIEQQLQDDQKTFDSAPINLGANLVLGGSGTQNVSTNPVGGTTDVKQQTEQLQSQYGLTASYRFEGFGKQPASSTSALADVAKFPVANAPKLTLLGTEIRSEYRLFLARLNFLKTLTTLSSIQSTEAGYGRLDAFGNARDLLWPSSPVPVTAPVSYPPLWEFRHLEYVHWDSDTTSVIERNMGQALGLGAIYDPATLVSTINPRNLHQLEVLAAKLDPPKWPEQLLGSIDQPKAKQGAALFDKYCASCHAPADGKEVLLSPTAVGTDPERANNFAVPLGGAGFDVAIQSLMERLKAQCYKDNSITGSEAKIIDGSQPAPGDPVWRVTKKYDARALRGVWATSPYLHNNSILNLHELLLPAGQRQKTFYAGCSEFDPVNVGFVSDINCRPKQFLFDTSVRGNSNLGHEYGTQLTEAERQQLIEFLKTY
ncbi:MAG: hypothetical protein WBQ43_11705 [Terriglobales bacterium]